MTGRRPLGRRLLLLSVGTLAVFATFGSLFGDRGLLQVRRYAREAEELRAEIRSLEHRVRTLHREIQALRSEPEAVERIARQELLLARPGEFLFLLPSEEAGPAAPPPADGAPAAD